jgi:hypothetical protein
MTSFEAAKVEGNADEFYPENGLDGIDDAKDAFRHA